MSNMSYCRFQNTLPDLRDCWENIDELTDELNGVDESEYNENDKAELRCRKRLIKLCCDIAEAYGDSEA